MLTRELVFEFVVEGVLVVVVLVVMVMTEDAEEMEEADEAELTLDVRETGPGEAGAEVG